MKEAIQKATKIVSDFLANKEEFVASIQVSARKIFDATVLVARSWSGSFAGYHAGLYYKDFQHPPMGHKFSVEWGGIRGIPEGWTEKTPEQVKAAIEQLTGQISLDSFEKQLKALRDDAEELQTEMGAIFSSFGGFSKGMEREEGLFAEIEAFEFGKTKETYVKANMPKQLMTRDSGALMQGLVIPSHLYYQGVAHEGESLCESTKKFLKLCGRFVRQVSSKIDAGSIVDSELGDLHPEILEKCQQLYESGSYAEAVEKGFKVVRDRLRGLTGFETGSEAFGKGKLHIKGAAAPNVDKDFNEGVKFLTMAIDRFRNEKSHTSNAKIDNSSRALEYLKLSSLAMHLLDQAEILP